jgi:uncharacterized protein (DUF924 family)
MAEWAPLLDWWFGDPSEIDRHDARAVAKRKHGLWFGYRKSQDVEARSRFGELTQKALGEALPGWEESPEGFLAKIVLLDQLPRMIFRGSADAFAGDSLALALARQALEQGQYRKLALIEQVFVYLPFEHAEDIAAQDISVAHFSRLRDECPPQDPKLFDDFLLYAHRHRDVVRRFGRFPHRNAALGRQSSDEETSFLQRPGSSF